MERRVAQVTAPKAELERTIVQCLVGVASDRRMIEDEDHRKTGKEHKEDA